jgi:hypothetical protein
MGIFEAGVRRRAAEEDILTSYVFGSLEILDRDKFLLPVLKKCKVELAQEAIPENFAFSYWKKMDKRTPDVILEDKLNLILFENKLNIPLKSPQLVEEYEDGVRCGKNLWLVAVTSDRIEPAEVEQTKERLIKNGTRDPRIRWTNWQTIYAVFRRNASIGNETEQKFANQLLCLLEAKGLRDFDKFDVQQLEAVVNLYPKWTKFLSDCFACLKTLEGRLEKKKFYVHYPRIEPALESTHSYISIDAWDHAWVKAKKKKEDKKQYLHAVFHVYTTSAKPLELIAGYFLEFRHENKERAWKLRNAFSKRVMRETSTLIERLKEQNYSVICYSGSEEPEDIVSGEELNKELFSQESLEKFTVIGFGRIFDDLEEIASAKLLDKVENCLIAIRDIINENNLYIR